MKGKKKFVQSTYQSSSNEAKFPKNIKNKFK